MKSIIVFTLFLISAFSPSLCSSTPQVIQPDPSFQMIVLDGWSVIDNESMRLFNRMSSRAGRQHYNVGIRRTNSKHVFDYPYILIQIKHDRKHPTTKELSELPRRNAYLALSKNTSSPVDKNKMYFDEFENAVFMVSEMKLADGTVINAISLSYLIKTGRISISLYCKPSKMNKYIDGFRFMTTTALIDEFYKYNPAEIQPPPRP